MRKKGTKVKVMNTILAASLAFSSMPVNMVYAEENATETELNETVENEPAVEEIVEAVDVVSDEVADPDVEVSDETDVKDETVIEDEVVNDGDSKQDVVEDKDSDEEIVTDDEKEIIEDEEVDDDEVVDEEVIENEECMHEEVTLVPETENTHNIVCKDCDEIIETVDCEFDEEGKCECGNEIVVEEVTEKCIVTFLGFEDTEISKTEVEKGTKISDIEFPEVPEVEGYEFSEWEENENEEISEDIVIRAIYKEKKTFVKVTFVGYADEVLDTLEIEKGGKIAEDYEIEAPEVEGFVFSKWDTDYKGLEKITEDTTIKAVYDFCYKEKKVAKYINGSTVSVAGEMPQNAVVEIQDASYAEQYEEQILEEKGDKITLYKAYDVKIKADLDMNGDVEDDEIWQPQEYGKSVKISVSNVEEIKDIEKYAEETVEDVVSAYRISDDGEVVELEASVSGTTVTMETDHFTIFTVGGVDYNTADGYRLLDGTVYKLSDATATYDLGVTSGAITGYLFDDGMLYIEGTGDMKDYSNSSSNRSPFYNNATTATKVLFSDGITSIGKYAFHDCSGLIGNLVIPNSVTSINESAFALCSGLTGSLVIPDSVIEIGRSAFGGCSGFNGTLTIGNSITKINYGTFDGCSSLTGNLVIPNNITTIGENAFRDCKSFTGNLVIPDSVILIDDGAFWRCTGFNGTLTIGKNVTTIGYSAFCYCSGFTGNLVIPDSVTTMNGDSTNYSHGAFQGCSGFNGTLTIGKGLNRIDSHVFYGCTGLTGKLIIPDNITVIDSYAFGYCTGLTGDLVIPDSITWIERCAFYNCSGFNGTLTIGSNLNEICFNVFYNCAGLTGKLVIPDSVTSIEYRAFEGCSGFTALSLGNQITTIGRHTFYRCEKLTDLGDLSNITSMATNAFDTGNTNTKTKISVANDYVKSYNWSGDYRITEWDDLDSITATYTGSGVTEGLKPSVSDFKVSATYDHGEIGLYNTKTVNGLAPTSITCDPMTVGSNNEVTVSYTENGVTKITTVNVTGIAKSETSRTLNSITATYNNTNVIEGLKPDKSDITVTGNYTITYNNGTSETKDITISSNDVTLTATTSIGSNIATVEYGGKSDTFVYTGIVKSEVSRTLQSITASTSVLSIKEGKTYDTDNITVEALYEVSYDNGTTGSDTVTIAHSNLSFSGDLTSAIGTNTIGISFTDNGVTKTTDITYTGTQRAETSRTLQSIVATYTGNDIIEDMLPSKNDIKVVMTYEVFFDNGSTSIQDVIYDHADSIQDLTVSQTPATIGSNSYTVSYEGKTSTITVNAVAKQVVTNTATEIKVTGTIPIVIENQNPDLSNLVIKETHHIVYDNGTEEDTYVTIPIADCTVSGDTTAHAGTNIITITYGTFSDTTAYTANEKQIVLEQLISIDDITYPTSLTEGQKPSADSIKATGTYTVTYDNGQTETVTKEITNPVITVEDKVIQAGTNTYEITVESDTLTETFTATITGTKKPVTPTETPHTEENREQESTPTISVILPQNPKPVTTPAIDFPFIIDIIMPEKNITEDTAKEDVSLPEIMQGFEILTEEKDNTESKDNTEKVEAEQTEQTEMTEDTKAESETEQSEIEQSETAQSEESEFSEEQHKSKLPIILGCILTGGLLFFFLLFLFLRKKKEEDEEEENETDIADDDNN